MIDRIKRDALVPYVTLNEAELKHYSGAGYAIAYLDGDQIIELQYVEEIDEDGGKAEIERAIAALRKNGLDENKLTLLHCNSEYPSPFEDLNLNAIETMRDYFKIDVGLSDHSEGFEASLASVALGVTIIEKHFTLDNALEGPDHSSSLNPKDFKSLIEMIRNVERALGSGIKKPSESESKNIKFMRRSLVARNKIKKGEVFSTENIAAKRPADGMSPMEWEEIEGKVSDRDYAIDDLIQK